MSMSFSIDLNSQGKEKVMKEETKKKKKKKQQLCWGLGSGYVWKWT
jgi:hypothetical protein